VDGDIPRPTFRYVNIPCVTRKHRRSLVTYRYRKVATMMCIPCDQMWTVPIDDPGLAPFTGKGRTG
jgi:hypothetical protein